MLRPTVLAMALFAISFAALAQPGPTAEGPEPQPQSAPTHDASVLLRLFIDADGSVARAELLRGADAALEGAALQAAVLLRFAPLENQEEAGSPAQRQLEYEYRRETTDHRAEAPKGVLEGTVLARGTRRPVEGALVVAGAARASTDAGGHFRIELPEGVHPLRIVAQGFVDHQGEETVTAAASQSVLYRLEPRDFAPDYTAVVRAEPRRHAPTQLVMDGDTLARQPGTSGEPLRALMQMPGVASVGPGMAYPVVRGTPPASTGYFLDGVRIPFLYHLLVGPSVVHPAIIDQVSFVPGAPGAEYGRLSGGVVDVDLRKSPDRFGVHAYADLLNAGAVVQSPRLSSGTAFTIAGRISYSPLLIAAVANLASNASDDRLVANFWDYQVRVDQALSGGDLRLLSFGSSDTVGNTSEQVTSSVAMATLTFHRLDLRWRQRALGGLLEAGLTYGFDRLGMRIGQGAHASVAGEGFSEEQVVGARASWSRPLTSELSIRAGVDGEWHAASVQMTGQGEPVGERGLSPSDQIRAPDARSLLGGAFLSAEWRGAGLTLLPGLRVDSYRLLPSTQHWAVEPRIAARARLNDDWILKLGSGLYHQPPTVLVHVPVAATSGLAFGLQRIIQGTVGLEWRAPLDLKISLDTYFNHLPRTVEFDIRHIVENRQPPGTAGAVPESRGRAFGVELMVQRPLGKRLTGWLSYAWQRSERYSRFPRYDVQGNIIGQGEAWLPFAFEQRHVLHVAGQYQLPGKVIVGAGVHFNTGRPETGQLSSLPRRIGEDDQGAPAWVPADLDRAERLPAFFRIDASVSRKWVFDDFTLEGYLDVHNISATREIVGWRYFREKRHSDDTGPTKEPYDIVPIILPMLGVRGQY